MFATLDRWSPHALAVLRIVAALLFMEHGTQKLFGFPAPPEGGMPPFFSLFGIGAVLELVGGFLILVGFLTRPVAFLLAGEMAVAYWMFHAPHSPYPALNGGDAAILFCFVFLLFVLPAREPGASMGRGGRLDPGIPGSGDPGPALAAVGMKRHGHPLRTTGTERVMTW